MVIDNLSARITACSRNKANLKLLLRDMGACYSRRRFGGVKLDVAWRAAGYSDLSWWLRHVWEQRLLASEWDQARVDSEQERLSFLVNTVTKMFKRGHRARLAQAVRIVWSEQGYRR